MSSDITVTAKIEIEGPCVWSDKESGGKLTRIAHEIRKIFPAQDKQTAIAYTLVELIMALDVPRKAELVAKIIVDIFDMEEMGCDDENTPLYDAASALIEHWKKIDDA
jgi:hypothetical protein